MTNFELGDRVSVRTASRVFQGIVTNFSYKNGKQAEIHLTALGSGIPYRVAVNRVEFIAHRRQP